MPHINDSITKIKICYSLLKNNVSAEDIPIQLDVHRSTIYRWIRRIKMKGTHKFIRDYEQAKKGRRQPRKTNPITKIQIYKVRSEYKDCCGEKIRYILKRDYGKTISVATIYRILNQRLTLRSKWKKYSKRGFVRKGTKPREVIQTDTVDLGQIFAYTAIDTFTKEASVVIKPSLNSHAARDALKEQLDYFRNIEHIQRDGGSEFKLEWQDYARKHISSIRTARPYKKNEQAYIERFNGILRKECLGYIIYRKSDLSRVRQTVKEFLTYYHFKRPHLSLDMKTPSEFAAMSHLT